MDLKLASHNSLTYGKTTKWWMNLLNFTSKCQNLTIEEQYDYGVRYFDIRLHFGDGCILRTNARHGIIAYEVDVFDVLEWLNKQSTEEDRIYVQLNLENLRTEDSISCDRFIRAFKMIQSNYPNIIFEGGYAKHPWRKIVDCPDSPVTQKFWEFYNFHNETNLMAYVRKLFVNLLRFSPKYWAKKNNKLYKQEGVENGFLMLDFVQYGDENN